MVGNESVSKWLQEISPEEPCGSNLEYDPSFLALEQAVLGKPEVQYGGTVTPEIPPDWKQVNVLAQELLARSLDLRIAVPMARALLKLKGIVGFATGMLLIEQLIEQRWDTVHPQLDPDDDLDPMLRINTLSALCESATVLRDVRDCVLVASKVHGRFGLREIDIATGELEPAEGEQKVALAVIDAAFRDADAEEMRLVSESLDQAYNANCRIETLLTNNVGASRSIDLSALSKLLKRARDFVRERIAAPNDVEMVQGVSDNEGAVRAAIPQAITGEINSRADVVRMLEKICAYYAKHEPASPVPLLLARAQRLTDKSFLEILEDLAPDGLSQMRMISGTQKDG